MAKRKAHMSHSGQTAMEYLLTYGWAILVVLVVIGALIFFGVLSPTKFFPDSCKLTNLKCSGLKITQTGASLSLMNTLGAPVSIYAANVTVKGSTTPCVLDKATVPNVPGQQDVSPAQTKKSITVQSGQIIVLTSSTTCNNGLTASSIGSKVSATLVVSYDDTNSGLSHDERGDALQTVES